MFEPNYSTLGGDDVWAGWYDGVRIGGRALRCILPTLDWQNSERGK
jgi:hypothetical protein